MGDAIYNTVKDLDTLFWRRVVSNIDSISSGITDIRVEDYIVGARYSAVKLADGRVGISYSYVMEDKCKPEAKNLGHIRDFIPLLSSNCIVERALGQAALNAVGQYYLNRTDYVEKDLISDILRILKRNDIVVFIGALKKIPDIYKSGGYKVYILDRSQTGRDILPDYFAYKIVPKARIVYITGAAFSRPDIDLILELSRKAEYRIEIGPSLTLPPIYLTSTGLTHLETSIIQNPESVFESIKLGMGYHDIRENLFHVSYKI
ncbi:MAG: hypothetical protein F7B59_02665 [Desulfurococcales archaeon]|nr:hypothetical protein [Desulfurococcales archaeon]